MIDEPVSRARRAFEIAQRYLDRPPELLPPLLQDELGDDPEMVDEVLSLLAAERLAGDFLASPVLGMVPRVPPVFDWSGVSVGSYRVTSYLGRGGMGTVYLGERADHDFEKTVAIKIADQVNARHLEDFRKERRILGRLDHPNIARLYDSGTVSSGTVSSGTVSSGTVSSGTVSSGTVSSGTVSSGTVSSGTVSNVPYFVMELVKGEPIDRYCENRSLGVAERLELVVRACNAVDYAHRNLVVHRDIKPANILVGEDGEPKLLDFGIAKLIDPAGENEVTVAAPRRLTFSYASPEQLRGQPITTASDVYSIGVVLYRLLTGKLPRTFPSTAPGEILDGLEKEVSPPSQRFDQAAISGVEKGDIGRDLDSITLKALSAEPSLRYPTVAELLADLGRLREGRPVRARGRSHVDRVAKFLSRHRTAAAVTLGILAMMAVFVGLAIEQSSEIDRQRQHAEASQQRTREVAQFLTDVLSAADPRASGDRNMTIREALDRGAQQVREQPAQDPLVQAMLLDKMGSIYLRIGEYKPARPLLRQALALRREAGLEGELPVAESTYHLAQLANAQADYHRAIVLFRSALSMQIAATGEGTDAVARSRRQLGWALLQAGRSAEAELTLDRAMASLQRAPDPNPLEISRTLKVIGNLEWARGDLVAAREHLNAALSRLRQHSPKSAGDIADVHEDLAGVAIELGDLGDAREHLDQAMAIQTSLYGKHSSARAGVLALMSRHRLAAGEPLLARQLADEALAINRDVLGPFGMTHLVASEVHARTLIVAGDLDAAEAELGMLLEHLREGGFSNHPYAARLHGHLGDIALKRGELESAGQHFRAAVRLRRDSLPETHYLLKQSVSRLAEYQEMQRQIRESGQRVALAEIPGTSAP